MIHKLLTPVAILTTQCHIGREDLEGLVSKLRSMHLQVPGAVAHLYLIQNALAKGRRGKALIMLSFHQDITDWRALAEQIAAWTTYLDEIV